VPDVVLKAYNLSSIKFGPEYIIPKPFDPRVLLWVAPAIAKAAMETGVARRKVDLNIYHEQLEARLGKGWELMRNIINKAQHDPKRVVFGEGEEPRIIRAAAIIEEQGIGHPILLGRQKIIDQRIAELGLDYKPTVIEPIPSRHFENYCQTLFQMRQRKGVTMEEAHFLMQQRRYFGPMMIKKGHADAYISGLNHSYQSILSPALQVIGMAPGVHKVAGMYIIIVQKKVYFFVDTTVNIDPTAEDLAEIAGMAADVVRDRFDMEPRIAMLSFSNFGSNDHSSPQKMRRAAQLIHERRPDLAADGEMMADTAVIPTMIDERFPFSRVRDANVLVFPNLDAANIAHKLTQRLGGAERIGPILLGMNKSIHVLQGSEEEVRDIVNMAAAAVIGAQA
jgi:malate dehydrogenase (oxaloacetate-decarboxylating)(NADP+)